MAKKTVTNTKSETNATLNSAEKATLAIPNTGRLEQADVNKDGINIKQALGALKLVDIADVDLLLTFANGERIVIPNGALDAVSSTPPTATFHDQKIALPELLKYVGLTYQAKPGSLRLVSENIDANPPSDIDTSDREPTPANPPPAPIVKVSPGTGVGKGLANGLGDVPETYNPLVTAQPSVYRVGKSASTPINDLIKGAPNFDVNLFTSNEFKVTPSGRTDNPFGAFLVGATSQELVSRSNPDKQATLEKIKGTSGIDNIAHNPDFALSTQWSKTIHATVSNISPTEPITIVIDQDNLALMPGFNIVGTGISHVSDSNTWTIDPALISADGINFQIIYDIDTRIEEVTVDFVAKVNMKGTSGPFTLDYSKQLYFTYRDVDAKTEDFTVTDQLTGQKMFVLPSKGLGVEVLAKEGDDIINTGAGNDLINGGEGADTINGGAGQDRITYDTSSDAVQVDLRSTTAQSSTGDASSDILSNIENLTGSNFDDRLTGSQVSNILKGLNGNDVLVSIGGGDALDGGDGNDTASYENATFSLIASLQNSSANAGDASGDTYISIENLTGGSYDDSLEGNASANHFDGDGNLDVASQAVNGDTVSYANAPSATGVVASLSGYFIDPLTGEPTVIASGDAIGDTFIRIENLTGSAFDDTLIGSTGSNILTGGAGNDTLEGLSGADKLYGGIGIDTASYAHATAAITADLSNLYVTTALQTGDAAGDIFNSIENLTGSQFDDTLIGDAGANVISGGDGNDTLEGLGNGDTFIGGAGTNTVTYIHSTAAVKASLTGSLSGFAAGGDAVGDTFNGISNLTGTIFGDTLVGDAINANILDGGAGDDTLEGLGGGDKYMGGAGTDTVSYERANNTTGITASLLPNSNETFGRGTQGIAAGDTYDRIENLTGTSFNDTLTGDNNNNTLIGGAGDDTLKGNGGADKIYGGDGNDEIYDDLNGAAIIDAGAGDDKVYISGSDGGADAINGGTGSDTLFWKDSRSFWYDMKTNASNFVGATSNTIITSFENFTNEATGVNAYDGWSSYIKVADSTNNPTNDSNTITGSATLIDVVDFSNVTSAVYANISNADIIINGITYLKQSATGGSGNDTLINIDHLYGTSAAMTGDILIGSVSDNTIKGYAGNDSLYGQDGNDILEGGAGADILYGGNGIDIATYENSTAAVTVNMTTTVGATGDAAGDTFNGIENLKGSTKADTLIGDSNANAIYGGGGDDTIKGGGGSDSLYGQAGNDTFLVDGAIALPTLISGTDNGATAAETDTITLSNAGATFTTANTLTLANASYSIEVLNIKDATATTLNITSANVRAFLDLTTNQENSTLQIIANNGDVINLADGNHFVTAGGNSAQLTQSDANGVYTIFNSSNVAQAVINWQHSA